MPESQQPSMENTYGIYKGQSTLRETSAKREIPLYHRTPEVNQDGPDVENILDTPYDSGPFGKALLEFDFSTEVLSVRSPNARKADKMAGKLVENMNDPLIKEQIVGLAKEHERLRQQYREITHTIDQKIREIDEREGISQRAGDPEGTEAENVLIKGLRTQQRELGEAMDDKTVKAKSLLGIVEK